MDVIFLMSMGEKPKLDQLNLNIQKFITKMTIGFKNLFK
jgi:hypothetical protein